LGVQVRGITDALLHGFVQDVQVVPEDLLGIADH
jgi:hypothetical protein